MCEGVGVSVCESKIDCVDYGTGVREECGGCAPIPLEDFFLLNVNFCG